VLSAIGQCLKDQYDALATPVPPQLAAWSPPARNDFSNKLGQVCAAPQLGHTEAVCLRAVLADLLSIWLAGHAPIVREETLQLHIAHVRELIEINEKLILGEQGHPQTNMGN
jgi:hypothetical protein